jgi:DNA-binding CsgD family transcriptional regulator
MPPIVVVVATETQRSRCRERLEVLAGSGLDTVSLQVAAVGALKRVVGFDRWCWPSADPETLVPGSGVADHDYGPQLPRALELEYSGMDYAAKDVLAAGAQGATSLRLETEGDLMRSPRWEEVMSPVGIGDVAAVACQDRFGCWGWVEVYRDRSDRAFDEAELGLLAQVGATLGSALRRRSAVRLPAVSEYPLPSAAPGAVGVLVLDAELRPVGRTEAATAWLAALPAAALFEAWGMLPASVYPVAALSRRGATHRAHALLPTESGGWARIDAAPLHDGAGSVAVTFRPPTAEQLFALLARTHGLTNRESQASRLLATGETPATAARRMGITPNTLHDHVKSAMRKVEVHTRAELVARLTGPEADRAE